MRITTELEELDLVPGESAEFAVDVINTGDLIEGVSARIIGLSSSLVKSYPLVLPLFPDSTGRMVLTLTLPASFPAGRHPLSVEVKSRTRDTDASYTDIDLIVPPHPGLLVSAHPKMVRSRRSSRFVLTLTNPGNVALDVRLTASDPQAAMSIKCSPSTVTVPAGATLEPIVEVKSRRVFLGSDTDKPITVAAAGVPVRTLPLRTQGRGLRITEVSTLLAAAPDRPVVAEPISTLALAPEPLTEASCVLTVRHRPYFTRGLLTVVILLTILLIWAAVFLFGLNQVFTGDPQTKSAPASFFAASSQVAALNAAAAAGEPPPTGPAAGAQPALAPAGALPKDGTLPAGLGGAIGGTVTAMSNGAPVGRILVEAQRQDRSGAWISASSAATQADGSYEVSGLFPGRYVLRLSADGFQTAFAPGVSNVGAASPVEVNAGAATANVNAVITGNPATITGKIDPGDNLLPVVSQVTVTPIGGTGMAPVVPPVATDADGKYSIPDLPAPFTYELSFTTPGYQATSIRSTVTGGSQRFEPTVVLGTAPGSITGLVTDGIAGLGGVAVATSVDGKDVVTGTPTTGSVGQFALAELPTPATYVLTFSAKNYATQTIVVDLGPGEVLGNLKVPMVGGTGLVSGRLVDASGKGLGGATVTVGGTENPPTTTTVTDGDVGSFSLAGLPSPGSYTITFRLPEYADQTVPLTLTSESPPSSLLVTMASSLGRITGRVLDAAGNPMIGIAVTATDGKRLWPSTTTAASGGQPSGGFVIAQLPVGPYTLTARTADGRTVTALVPVQAGMVAATNFTIPGGQ
ncbi:carboxypeptidase regulatory-like domain-containing protein [Nakamurella antarctica]|uniref:Carboxypeptidase regulatory-like domain-containing protein n=1 Tax=Nakamurella antarctica TaxID=1902245 RepID=A0A3G8ZMK0_9ACTN|nr:carboxypeptidase regulatory-like domain-containing protein [Nakamurella antarctica]AZI58015.1 carboxypeptidase regulatory-like domain-containing protein [Nakamurella antarctica]